MGLLIEPATMFLALVAVSLTASLVLLWSFWLNGGDKSPLWTALGLIMGAVATFVMAHRESLPVGQAVILGGVALLAGIGFLTVAAQSFNRKPIELWIVVAGPAAWLMACSFPAVYDSLDGRVVTLSVLSALLYFAAAREYHVRDGLLTRLPMTILITAQGLFCLSRLPFVLTDNVDGLAEAGPQWFGVTALESFIFIQFLSFLTISLTKERVEKMLRAAAHTDQLTELGNRRAFFMRGEAAISQAARNGSPISVVVFDLDHFKVINDRFGHPTGDAVIKAFAQAATSRLRASDFVARLGGEEFAALLPDTDGEHAALVALQINHAFEMAVAGMRGAELTCTASAGVARLTSEAHTLDAMLSAADRALYDAKALGRGQVRLATAPGRSPAAEAA